jgi:hypothetical protein
MRAWSVLGQVSEAAPLQVPVYSTLVTSHAVFVALVIHNESELSSSNFENSHLKVLPLHSAIFMSVSPRHGYDSAAIIIIYHS